ncbi:MAG: sulfatase/phosphatase domain-containing protein, partial [bacterium]
GVEQNTLVIFLSDNGGCAEILRGNDPNIMPGSSDSYMSYGIGWANVSNSPFRRYKKWVYEGGIATPLIARWPGKITAGSVTQQVGHVIDLMPTLLEITGVKYPDRELLPLDGKSLLPVFLGKTREAHETLYWEHLGNQAIRQGNWKLVLDHELNEWELYNLEEDRTETHNVVRDYPQKAKEMSEMWLEWAKEVRVWPKKYKKKSVK